jgi:hypothetical protein
MKISSFHKQVIRTVQFSIAALICSVALNFGTAAPSIAGSSSITKGTEQLTQIDDKAAKIAERSSPMGLAEIEARSKNGLNEIQGSADKNKMYKADTSKPGPAIAEKIEKALDKVTK